jgi:hypothetical protein
LNITYGYAVKDCDDPLVILADECTTASVSAGPIGSLLCDLVPARTFQTSLSKPYCELECSEELANLGSLLRVQEACVAYQISGRKVLRRTIPMDKGPNGGWVSSL